MESLGMQLLANQWRLCRIQLINWGTFDGYHDMSIRAADAEGSASVVCITGKSGTGKSTLFDAGTVLMMPYGRTLNAASNLARGGSPREVRTYLKGMIDTVADSRGRAKGKYLRDDTSLIWSAIVHTWVDATGAPFSAARFFQLKPGGGDHDLDQTLVTLPGPLDPRALQPYAATRFRSRDVQAVYEGCTVHNGTGDFLRTVYRALGIGADGNGTNAMKLLYRIQSGIPMTNVDDLFKELVLDPPTTIELAQAAVDCYDQNQSVWKKIDEAKRKRAMLEHIDEDHASMLEAQHDVELVSSLRHTSQQGAFRLWVERHRLELAQAEAHVQRSQHERRQGELTAATQQREEAKAELSRIQASIFEKGGGTLQQLRARLSSEEAEGAQVERRRNSLNAVVRDAGRVFPRSEQAWNELVAWADDAIHANEAQVDELQSSIDELGARVFSAQQKIAEREKELEYYRTHRTCITRRMAEARELMARAAGLDPDEIPFAAELMDVPREQELWRTAVNISLAHVSDRILVDKSIESEFRRSVDRLANQLGRRYHYDFVDLDADYLATPKDRHVSSKVVYRNDSPFAPYVRNLVCNHSTDHLCVDTVGQLAGKGARITPSGQERVGNRGAIGHSRNTLIIGFANEMLIEDCEAELEDARAAQRELRTQLNAYTRQRKQLEHERLLAQSVCSTTWPEVDVDGIHTRIEQTRADITRIEQDDELKALEEMLERVQLECDHAITHCSDLERDIRRLSQSISELELVVDQSQQFTAALEQTGLRVTQDQVELCERAMTQTEQALADREAVIRSYDRLIDRARAYLDELLKARTRSQAQHAQTLQTAFRNYHGTFMPDDSEHGTGVDEYPYYHGVLSDLIEQGLDDPEEEWEAEMLRDVAQRLSRLQDAFVTEERALSERLRPVNEILGQFVFGERRGHLSVVSERLTMSDVTRFRRKLRRLTSLATTFDFADEAHVKREHRQLSDFIEFVRRDLATTGKFARRFLDVRHTVRITARETPPEGVQGEAVVYDSINGKSGGQYQELVAFILGAALLYCLGYNSATMPSYAPVYLDEAFIKADSEHTQRALGALSGLGFQVIIAVPDGKVEAVAPLASQIIGLTKDERTNTTHVRWLTRVSGDEDGASSWQD